MSLEYPHFMKPPDGPIRDSCMMLEVSGMHRNTQLDNDFHICPKTQIRRCAMPQNLRPRKRKSEGSWNRGSGWWWYFCRFVYFHSFASVKTINVLGSATSLCPLPHWRRRKSSPLTLMHGLVRVSRHHNSHCRTGHRTHTCFLWWIDLSKPEFEGTCCMG